RLPADGVLEFLADRRARVDLQRLAVGTHRPREPAGAQPQVRLLEPELAELARQAVHLGAALRVGLLPQPGKEHGLLPLGVHSDAVVRAGADRDVPLVRRRVEVEVHPQAWRHVAADAIATYRGREPRVVGTRRGLVAGEATTLGRQGPVRVVT